MSKPCKYCTIPATRSGIFDGVYEAQLCVVHFNRLVRAQMPSVGSADYDRGRDFEENMADAIQPYDKQGNPSKDFIAMYGDKAREMWDEETIRKASL